MTVDKLQQDIVKIMAGSGLNMMERAAVLTSVMFVQLNFKENMSVLKEVGLTATDLSVDVVIEVQKILTLEHMKANEYVDDSEAVIAEAEKLIEEDNM
ncbi:hypothetical protein FM106_18715 [Brachybacterium faecium]|nr:hypothetical protein FM106_18715 [Brachybacterium faecium]